jgi:hypothetical protein
MTYNWPSTEGRGINRLFVPNDILAARGRSRNGRSAEVETGGVQINQVG